MGIAFVIVAAVFAYGAAGTALLLGAGWLMALLVLSGVGTAAIFLMALYAILRTPGRPGRSWTPAAAPRTDPAY